MKKNNEGGFEWLNSYPDPVKKAIKRLASDARFKAAKLAEIGLWRIAMEYDQAIARDTWDEKTQRERDIWLNDFEKTVERLLVLASTGPRPPARWGFPVRDTVLMSVASRMGCEVLPSEKSKEYFGKMIELEDSADKELWHLDDSIKHYLEQIKIDCKPQQILKKPGDEKAKRAAFIISMKENSNLGCAEIATIAAILFEDEAIDDRLVRRLTSGVR